MIWRERLAVLLGILTCVSFLKVGCCPNSWLSFDTTCIRIVDDMRSQFTAGGIFCIFAGGKMASVSSVDMLEFLSIHTYSFPDTKFWVGLTRDRVGKLEWFDGVSAENQPWVQNVSLTQTSGCSIFTGDRVESTSCLSQHGFICSRNRTMYEPTENCLRGLTNHSFIGEETGNCVYRTYEATTRENADAKCAKTGGTFLDLDEIMRDGLSAFHEHKVMMNDGFKYWTSLRMNGSNVYWRSGEPLQSVIPFILGKGECITVSFNFTNVVSAVLYQTECKDHAHVICAAPAPASPIPTQLAPLQQQQRTFCPVGHNWKEYNGNCFWETSFETSRLSWDEARQYCQGFGGDLASFHSTDEEKVGLSFQYNSLAHPYWIGLRLDLETETYKWSDGTSLDYENWAPGHPDHKDKRLRCVAMDAQSTTWMSSLCGILSWFVCRVPKRPNPPPPVVPTRKSLRACEPVGFLKPTQFYFQGYCYSVVNKLYTWYRAKEYCENEGSSLVSIHSDEEIGFLLRMLYDDKDTKGNRVWIGLNSLRGGTLRWTDYSPVDFTYWNENEPNNVRNLEKCCSMYMGNGFWNDEICNELMGFVCKQVKNATFTPEIPSTPDPLVGNCKKGWIAHHDRCYLPVGFTEKERVNWTEASQICENHGGYLISIRDRNEQAFLAYLMQGLKEDTWIGLHDTIHSGRYYWLDNSDIRYTNWAVGEPSFFGIQEDCVKMVHNELNSGAWRDDLCNKKLPFICYTEKDPQIPKPNYYRGLNCIYPEGWLKLDDMCFKMFAGNPMTWREAEITCEREGAHLIAISGTSVQAVANYLGTEVNQTFWIGLQYKEPSLKFEWLNGWPVSLTKWGKNEPSGKPNDGLCFGSTSDGYWGRIPCQEEMAFICQITPNKIPPRKRYTGECPKTSDKWISSDGSYCHLHESIRAEWFAANIRCFTYGSYLISLHSLEDLETVRKTMKPDVRSVYIGLMRNEKEGFSWTDQSPVDFVNWDRDQPENQRDNCVEMLADSLKWRVVPCQAVRNFICSFRKDQQVDEVPENSQLTGVSFGGLSAGALTGIVVCSILVIVAIIGVIYFRPTLGRSRFRNPFRQQSVSYENALYNVDSASMEFQDDRIDSCDSR